MNQHDIEERIISMEKVLHERIDSINQCTDKLQHRIQNLEDLISHCIVDVDILKNQRIDKLQKEVTHVTLSLRHLLEFMETVVKIRNEPRGRTQE